MARPALARAPAAVGRAGGPPARRRRSAVASPAPPAATAREEQVYAAALELFRRKGYHATSMQEIAEAVGLYKGSLYHYISGKEDLLVHVFERALGTLVDEVERIAADTRLDPATQLRRAIRAHVGAVAGNLEALTVYLHEWRALDGDALARVRAQRERYAGLLEAIVARGVELGRFRRLDVGVATLGILGMCNWLSQWYHRGGRLDPGEIGDCLVDLVLGGLLAPPPPSAGPPPPSAGPPPLSGRGRGSSGRARARPSSRRPSG